MVVKVLVYVALLILLAGCLAQTRSELVDGNNPRHEAARLGDPNHDVVAYAELCKSELGIEAPIPDALGTMIRKRRVIRDARARARRRVRAFAASA